MMRRLGVLVALCALATTASADKPKPKAPTPTAKKKAADPAPADQAPPDDGTAGSADDLDGSDAGPPMPPHITGPQLVDLGHDTQIDLPAGMILLEHDEAKKLIEKGGGNGDAVVAYILPLGIPDQTWEMFINYEDAGYVKDTDADELDPNDLFNVYKQGTEEDNVRRRSLGVPELFLDGWSEMPKYDKPTHKLVWGFKAHSTDGPNVNYFARLLGRNGYLSVDLIDAPDKIEIAKQQAAALMAGIKYKPGATYEDHKGGDKDSGMGLKALIVGGAGIAVFKAAKGGWIIAALLAMKKLIILVVAGIAAFFKKIGGLFKRKGNKVELPPDGPPPVG